MEALYESEFIDLKNFTKSTNVKAKYPYYSFKVIEQNTNNIYLAKEFRYPIYKFNRNEIISLSQEINVFSQVNHPSILKFVGYNPINFDKKPIPVIITEYTSYFTLKKMLSSERKGKEHPPIDDTKKLIIIY